MTPFNYQRTRWLTLIGTIITQFALGSVYTGVCLTVRFLPSWGLCRFFGLLSLGWQFRLLLRVAGTFWC